MKNGFTLSRRKFLWNLGTAAVAAIVAAPVIEAATTVFTPPAAGWPSCKCGKPHHLHSKFDFDRDYLKPAVQQLADDIDRKALAAYQDAYNGAQSQALDQVYFLDRDKIRTVENRDGLSMRFVRNYDIDSDKFPVKLDVLFGMGVLQPNLAARISNVAVAPEVDLSQQRVIDWVEKG